MVASTRWFWSGGDAALRAAIAAKLGGGEVGDDLALAKKGELIRRQIHGDAHVERRANDE